MVNISTKVTTRQQKVPNPAAVAPQRGLSAISKRSMDLQQTMDRAIGASPMMRDFQLATIRAVKPFPGVVAAIWTRVENGKCTLGDMRLQGPAFEREDVQDWIRKSCIEVCQDQTKTISNSEVITNLCAVLSPTARPEGGTDVLVILVTTGSEVQVENGLHAGQLISRALMLWHSAHEVREKNRQLNCTAAVLDICGRIESAFSVQEAAMVLANVLKDYFSCQNVAVGICRTTAQKSTLTAISGVARMDANSASSRAINAALDEAILRSQVSGWPPPATAEQHQLLAHQQLCKIAATETIFSAPLKTRGGTTVGAVTILAPTGHYRKDIIQFLDALTVPIGNAIDVVKRSKRSLPVRIWRQVVHEGGWKRKLAITLSLAAVAGIMAIPMPYRIACRFTIEPMQRQFSVAPYAGLLRTTYAEPGDIVEEGQILARMDDQEVHWELSGVEADSERASKERDVHLVDREIARSYMSALESERLKSRSELLKHRLSALEIRSAVRGVVLSGSVDRRENYPVKVGELLYEIAPIDKVRFEVGIPAEDVVHVEVGQKVALRVDGNVSTVLEATIDRIRPRSEIIEGSNVFVAEVRMNITGDVTLLPGMEGTARVVTASHSLGWNLFHRAWEYIASNLLW